MNRRQVTAAAPLAAPIPPVYFGDRVADGLKMLGITPERFSAWMGAECGCAERQEKLNRFGRYLAKRAKALGAKLPF